MTAAGYEPATGFGLSGIGTVVALETYPQGGATSGMRMRTRAS